MKSIGSAIAALTLALATAGCTGPTRRPDPGRYADQARMKDTLRGYEAPNGKLDPLIFLNPDLYGGWKRSRAPVFDVPLCAY